MIRIIVLSAAIGVIAATSVSAEEPTKDLLAAQIRDQGSRCTKPVSAHKDVKRSKPDEAVWLLKCENATYRIRLIKDGRLYGFDRADNKALYRVPVTRVEDVAETFEPGKAVHFCPGPVGGAEWNSPAYVPQTNLILVGEVEWCATVTPKTVDEVRSVKIGQPWIGMATWNPFWVFGRMGGTEGHWAGWLYAVDADTGVWKWRLKSNYPIVGGMTPTAGGVVFFGDIGGNFYALDAANGQKLWGQELGGAIGGGVITYSVSGAQKVAVAAGFTHIAWPTKIVKAKIVVLGLDSASVTQ